MIYEETIFQFSRRFFSLELPAAVHLQSELDGELPKGRQQHRLFSFHNILVRSNPNRIFCGSLFRMEAIESSRKMHMLETKDEIDKMM